jgi:uncharacterized protein (DUF2236 family)
MIGTFRLPSALQRRLEAASSRLLHPTDGPTIDFAQPRGAPALVSPDSVSWRIFKNPIALLVGGIAAVILELAEPTVRTGVWEHSSFARDPLNRLRRTGQAAMVTVYGPRSLAEPMIARVVRLHSRVAGHTAAGTPYSANEAVLLTWVHATAAYGFARAYSAYGEQLSRAELDAFYREGIAAARLYGASHAPSSSVGMDTLFRSMQERLEPSPIVFRFLEIMRETAALPRPLFWMQKHLVRAAVELIPDRIRQRLGLDERFSAGPRDTLLTKLAGGIANRLVLQESPAAQSCLRLGLPINYLYP